MKPMSRCGHGSVRLHELQVRLLPGWFVDVYTQMEATLLHPGMSIQKHVSVSTGGKRGTLPPCQSHGLLLTKRLQSIWRWEDCVAPGVVSPLQSVCIQLKSCGPSFVNTQVHPDR